MPSARVPVSIPLIMLVAAVSQVAARTLQHHQCAAEECDAVRRRDGETIRAFIQEGRFLCTCLCESGGTLLHEASVSECIVCADLLLKAPSNCPVNAFTSNYDTPLHAAASVCQSPMTNLFLDRGARANPKNMDDVSPLCAAAAFDSENCGGVIKDLVAKGADICMTCNGTTPYSLAVNPVAQQVLAQLDGDQC